MLMTMYVILDVCDYDIFMHKFIQSDKWKAGNSTQTKNNISD